MADPSAGAIRDSASRSFSRCFDLLGVACPDHRCKIETDNPMDHDRCRGWEHKLGPRGDKNAPQFAVIDGKTVITGLVQLSRRGPANDESALVGSRPRFWRPLHQEMDRMWQGAELGSRADAAEAGAQATETCGSGTERGAGIARGSHLMGAVPSGVVEKVMVF